jgi:hypothetical protein
MSQLFTYDIGTLTELIESKPCVCDKTSDIYKDKIDKSKTCRDFFSNVTTCPLWTSWLPLPVFVVEM